MKVADLSDDTHRCRPLPFRFVCLRATIRRERETKRRLTPQSSGITGTIAERATDGRLFGNDRWPVVGCPLPNRVRNRKCNKNVGSAICGPDRLRNSKNRRSPPSALTKPSRASVRSGLCFCNFVNFVPFCSSPLCTDHRLCSSVAPVTPSEFAHFANASSSARDGRRRAMQLIRRHAIERFVYSLTTKTHDLMPPVDIPEKL
jgi:hypothetical protein